MEKIARAIVRLEESGQVERLNEVNTWLWDYANTELGGCEQWEIYADHYPEARMAFCDDVESVSEFFGPLASDDILKIIVDCQLDFTKYLLVQNPDVMAENGTYTWTVYDATYLPGWESALDANFENFDFWWIDEDVFFEEFPDLLPPKEKTYTVYDASHDITFAMRETEDEVECLGIHLGKPFEKFEDNLLSDAEPLFYYK